MADGDPAAAHASLCAVGYEQRTSIVPVFPIDVIDEIPLARIALAAGDVELAEVAAAQADRRAQLNPGVATIVATAAHVRGLLTSNIEELERAVDLFATGPRPIVRGYALEDLGVAHAAPARSMPRSRRSTARWSCLRRPAPPGTRAVCEAACATTGSADASSRASAPRPAGRR